MTLFLDELKNEICPVPGDRDAVSAWFSAKEEQEKEWLQKRAACEAAETARSTKDQECDEVQGDYEGDYCTHRQAVYTTCSTYLGCYELQVKNFEKVLETTEVTQEGRKIEFTALEKIKCFIKDVLMSDEDNEKRQGNLEKCQSTSVPTDHLTLAIPAINSKEVCDLTEVAVHPGTASFPQRYEGMLDVRNCQACSPIPASLNVGAEDSCIEVDDKPVGWTNSHHAVKDGITYMGGYDVSAQTVSKLFSLSPHTKYKWSVVLDTWASVDNEVIVIKADGKPFNIPSRPATHCSNGWKAHPYGLGQAVGSTGSGKHNWQDCFMEVENIIETGANGNIRVEMHMAIDQAKNDEAWGWHNMKFVPVTCPGQAEKITDDCSGWSTQKTAQRDGICYMGAFDNSAQTVTKTFGGLTPGCSYSWRAEIDTYASVDGEPMVFTVNKQPFLFSSRHAGACNNGWIEYPNDFGDFVGSHGSAHSGWKDCHKTFAAEFIAPASGAAEIEMHMAIDQAINDEGWGWHSMEFERGSCASHNRVVDDCTGWSVDKKASHEGICYMGAFDNSQQTVTKTFERLAAGCTYKWSAVIDTWASVDNEKMKFSVNGQDFEFTSRTHNACDNGWTEYPHDFGNVVGSHGSQHGDWKDCYKTFEKTFIVPVDGKAHVTMHMDINQDINDEGWGWHSMVFEKQSCGES
jgi:hypothetical protein